MLFAPLFVGFAIASVVELTPKNFDDVVDGSKAVLVKFFAPWCGKNMAADYEKLAKEFKGNKDVVIAEVNADEHRDLGSRFGVQGFPTLKWFPKGKTTGVDFNSGRDLNSLRNSVIQKLNGGPEAEEEDTEVTVLTPENFDDVVDGSSYVLVEFYGKNLAPIYESLAVAFKGKSNIVIAKVNADAHSSLGSKYGVKGFPTIKWFHKSTKAEEYDSGRDLESFIKFISERTGVTVGPASADSDVVTLSPANFDKIVKDKNKNVLVEFYGKALAPIYETVATVFKNEPNCVVAKLDADANRELAAPYDVKGFPTISNFHFIVEFFGKFNKEEPLDYNLGRTAKDLISYLNVACGTMRDEKGQLESSAGVIKEFSKLIKKLEQKDDKKDLEEILADAKKLAEKDIKQENGSAYLSNAAKYYVKVFEKIVQKGKNYIATEFSRLGRLLKKGDTLLPEKLDDLRLRKNVLSDFAASVKSNTKDEV